MKVWLKPIPAICLLLTAMTILSADPANAKKIRKTFDVKPGGELVVDTDVGSIEIKTIKQNQVEVEVLVSGRDEDDFKIDFKHQGEDVEIRGDRRKRSIINWGKNLKVRFRILVPEHYNIDIETSGGSIIVDDLEGRVHAETSGGSLEFGNINGPVRGHTSGGSITLEGCEGDADINTSGGSIRIGFVNGDITAHTSGGGIDIEEARGTVEAETSGGSIHVREVMGTISASTSGGGITAYITEQPRGDCRLTTSGGSVKVYLASDISLDLDARGGDRVRCDFDVPDRSRNKRTLVGEINGGGPELYLRSSGGGVRIIER
ncbi:MAG: DUF4097 family beta strand repeat protein [bacterium]|nr:DUF4097 family beta strand repeat protein [bacterium]